MKKTITLFVISFLFLFQTKVNAQSWSKLGAGANALKANNYIFSIATDNSGNIYAAGTFTNAAGKYYVAKWNGTNWSKLGRTGHRC